MAKLDFNAADHTVEEGQWRTFREWRELNFGVLKGEKARRFRHGVAIFHESQVAYIIGEDFDIEDEMYAIGMGGPQWWKD